MRLLLVLRLRILLQAILLRRLLKDLVGIARTRQNIAPCDSGRARWRDAEYTRGDARGGCATGRDSTSGRYLPRRANDSRWQCLRARHDRRAASTAGATARREPAAKTAPSPMVTPGTITTRSPIHTPSPIVTALGIRFLSYGRLSDDVQECRLTTPGSARNKNVLARQHVILKLVSEPSFESSGLYEVVDAEMAGIELSDCQGDAVQAAWRNNSGDAASIGKT